MASGSSTGTAVSLSREPRDLLQGSPQAVDSFWPGHWDFMVSLERRASDIIAGRNIGDAIAFFADIAFLKRPHTINRHDIGSALLRYEEDVARALNALSRVREMDYEAMDYVARLPWFGRRGGRSFASAVMRVVCPEHFGIIDWRNLAVLCDVSGFEGLIQHPPTFAQFTSADVLVQRGHLPFTVDVYRSYNDILRSLARDHELRVADIDLVLWTYSIQRQPFKAVSLPLFSSTVEVDQRDRHSVPRSEFTAGLVNNYLARLREAGVLTEQQILVELKSLFSLIRRECEAFGEGKKGPYKTKLALITLALDTAISTTTPGHLLKQWNRWQGMVDPVSPDYIGIDLPTDMILAGFLVLEDFVLVKEFIEAHYDHVSLAPHGPCD